MNNLNLTPWQSLKFNFLNSPFTCSMLDAFPRLLPEEGSGDDDVLFDWTDNVADLDA